MNETQKWMELLFSGGEVKSGDGGELKYQGKTVLVFELKLFSLVFLYVSCASRTLKAALGCVM